MGNVLSMTEGKKDFKAGGRWAATTNVSIAATAMAQALNRPRNLPGIVVLSGVSGLGKSMASAYCANQYEGFCVEVRDFFTKKALAQAILREMAIREARTVPEMMEQIAEELKLSRRPLILDEGDRLIRRNLIEIVRDLHDMSMGTIMLVGEEHFARGLLRHSERMHNRVLNWVAAQPASLADAKELARHYLVAQDETTRIEIDDELLRAVVAASNGVTRRVCVNLERVRQHCLRGALKRVTPEDWGKRPFYTGDGRRPQ